MPPALGTPEYTNSLIDRGSQLGLNLERYRVPTDASKVQNVPGLTMPDLPPTVGSITNATAGVKGLAEYFTQSAAENERKRGEVEKTMGENATALSGYLQSSKTRLQKREEAEKAAGVVPADYFADQQSRVAEITSLTDEYNKLTAARDTEIARVEEKEGTLLGGVPFASRAIEKKYAIRMNALSSTINSRSAAMEAMQGNFDRAQEYITQAVDDSVADKKDVVDSFDKFYDMNTDIVDRLDSRYSDALSNAFDLAKTEYENARADKLKIAEWQLKYPGVALNLNGSIEDAMSKLQASGQIVDDGAADFTSTQINEGANRSTLSVAEFKSLPAEVQNFFISSAQGVVDNVNALLKNVELGEQTPEEAKEAIKATSGLNPAVVTYLNDLIDATTPSAEGEDKGWWSNVWAAIRGK